MYISYTIVQTNVFDDFDNLDILHFHISIHKYFHECYIVKLSKFAFRKLIMSGLDYTPVKSIAQFISSYIPFSVSSEQTGGATIISFGLLICLIIVLIILLLVRRYKKYLDDKKRIEQFEAVQQKRAEQIKKKKAEKRKRKDPNKHVRFAV
jgi:hypothetical protein